jgi:myo-inositol 2-dehydrogenase / D-chiro-inositol 1-dehydrogenase
MNTATHVDRRAFIAATGLAGLACSVQVAGETAKSPRQKVKLAVIGCGGRGSWLGGLFLKHGGYEIVAACDFFQDRVDAFGDKCGVPPARRFTGLSSYKRVLELKPDAVAIITPPYFHPEQAAAAVDAGIHSYIAKPVAVDVPGCMSIADSGKRATEKGLSFLVDFQTRANGFYIEAIRRVHAGDIGELAFGETAYHTGRLRTKAKPGTPEARLRNWVFDKALSGDIITEQNIHALDVMNWVMNTPPLHAFGSGGRKVRMDVGDCWDYFTLHYQYPNSVGMTFSSRQFEGNGSKPDGITCRAFGSKGVLETQYGGNVMIRGKAFYRGGNTGQIYQEGATRNIATFYDAIASGKSDNPTVAPSVRSNLVTILGRTAAYTGELVTWDALLKDTTRLDAQLKGLDA